MDQEVRAAMYQADADETVCVIILTGAGRGFCAGADMSLLNSISQEGLGARGQTGFLRNADNGERANVRPDFQKKYSYFPSLTKPVIAAVNGPAVGLGFILTLYCDIRFASEGARSAVGLGLLSARAVALSEGVSHAMSMTGLKVTLASARPHRHRPNRHGGLRVSTSGGPDPRTKGATRHADALSAKPAEVEAKSERTGRPVRTAPRGPPVGLDPSASTDLPLVSAVSEAEQYLTRNPRWPGPFVPPRRTDETASPGDSGLQRPPTSRSSPTPHGPRGSSRRRRRPGRPLRSFV